MYGSWLLARAQARAMCASWPYHISSECVAELIASDIGDPEYMVSGITSVLQASTAVDGAFES